MIIIDLMILHMFEVTRYIFTITGHLNMLIIFLV
jgi:hypothetical protein